MLSHTLGEDPVHLQQIANSAYDEARRQKELQVAANAKSWATYAEEQLATGAGAAHRLTKRDGLPINDFSTVGEGESRTASSSLIVAADLKQWKEI